MKKNKSLIIIVMLIVLLILFGALIGLGYMKFNNLNKDYNDLSSKYETVVTESKKGKQEQEKLKSDEGRYFIYSYSNDDYLKVFYDFDLVKVIGYKGKVYAVDAPSGIFFLGIIECINETKIKNGKYVCALDGEEEDNYTIKLLDVDENDIYSVVVNHVAFATDASYHAFIIKKSGEVFMSNYGFDEQKQVFKNYKVKDVREFCAKPNPVTRCDEAGYKLTLQDGTVKEVTKLD